MAGVAGLEPTNDGIKTRCLTTWLYPNNILQMVRKERLELSRREALEPKSSVSTNSTTPAQSEPQEKLDKKKNWWLWRDSNLRPHHYE